MVDLVTEYPGSGGGGNAGSSFSAEFFNVYNKNDPRGAVGFDVAGSTPAVAILALYDGVETGRWVLPAGNGFLATDVIAIIDWTGLHTFEQALTVRLPGLGIDFADSFAGDPAVFLIDDVNLGGVISVKGPGGAGIATAQTVRYPEASGTLALRGDGADPPAAGFMGKVNRTAQTADIASVRLTDTCPAGQYLIAGELECTTGAGGAGAVTVTFSWTNDSGAKTSSVTLSLATAGSTPILIPAYLASGDVTWAVTHTGLYLTSQYAIRVRPISLG